MGRECLMDLLTTDKYNVNFFPDLLKYTQNNTIAYDQYPKVYKEIRKYERCIKSEMGKYLPIIKRLSTNGNSNRLFFCLTYDYLIRNDESRQLLVGAFRSYINNSYPSIDLCRDTKEIFYFLSSSEKDAFGQIAKWIIELKTGNELLYCSYCGKLLLPSFDSNYDKYECSDKNCSNKLKKYHNHCWNCYSTIDSEYNSQCKSCGWYICKECLKCAPNCKKQDAIESSNKLRKLDNLEVLSEHLSSIYSASIDRLNKKNPDQYNFITDYCSLNRGTKILADDRALDSYIAFYGVHHFSKLWLALKDLKPSWEKESRLSIYDWGCGQALASLATFEFVSQTLPNLKIDKFVLIDPSRKAVDRGATLLRDTMEKRDELKMQVHPICNYFENISKEELHYSDNSTNVHLFSNILDVKNVKLNELYRLTKDERNGYKNYYVCTSPKYQMACQRIEEFYQIFEREAQNELISEDSAGIFIEKYDFKKKKTVSGIVTRFQKIFTTH